ncbi:hypothetical protein [Sphingobium yanoikuyae]|uniref:Uncharacterized protein n=1 Tax=Sphingobium yanoikuyae TaxID=13690 RepID=A0A0J9FP88_SPHYA|nr:hypothetical protein [Sphingobium yanoikuyae]ATP18545.1 hypothetical protein BV87_09180 [Sphingobium yanoikuyae]KMW30180.1 hypothetical protein BV87_07370 [Sphingobium yanoikuyae]
MKPHIITALLIDPETQTSSEVEIDINDGQAIRSAIGGSFERYSLEVGTKSPIAMYVLANARITGGHTPFRFAEVAWPEVIFGKTLVVGRHGQYDCTLPEKYRNLPLEFGTRPALAHPTIFDQPLTRADRRRAMKAARGRDDNMSVDNLMPLMPNAVLPSGEFNAQVQFILSDHRYKAAARKVLEKHGAHVVRYFACPTGMGGTSLELEFNDNDALHAALNGYDRYLDRVGAP